MSFTNLPASPSFKIPMICSSVNRLFIPSSWLILPEDLHVKRSSFRGAPQDQWGATYEEQAGLTDVVGAVRLVSVHEDPYVSAGGTTSAALAPVPESRGVVITST